MNTKEKILECVETLIAKNNVNSFSIKDIADELNISKGTIFYYYQSKDDIILDIMEKHFSELAYDYDDWLERYKGELITKERFLEVIFYKGTKLFNKAKMHIYLINECASLKPNLKEQYLKLYDSWRKKLEEGINRVFKDCKDAEQFSYLLLIIIDGLTVKEVLNPDENVTKNIVNEIAKRW
ncbi:MAG: TetR/AcrR family transcriptional regulator [Bacilli bacterium]